MSTIEKLKRKLFEKPVRNHGKTVKEAYIMELKELFDEIGGGEND